MKNDSKDESKERAKALREQISEILHPKPASPSTTGNESPAEFVRRRRKEMDQKKEKP